MDRAAAPGAAIRGNLRETSLPDVLQLLALSRKTGRLSVSDRSNFGSIFLEHGRVTYAMLVNRGDRLGDLLLHHGNLTAEELTTAIQEQKQHPGVRLGQLLLDRGAVSREDLEQCVRIQIEEAVYDLMTWSQGTFHFESDKQPEGGILPVSLGAEALLLEGARRIDEWSVIEQDIPSFDSVFEPGADKPTGDEPALTFQQEVVLSLIDGRRSVREIVDESGLAEFDVGKAVYGLLHVGLVQPVDERPPPASPHAEVHRNLGLAFYRTAMWKEATREWNLVSELDPASYDPAFYLGLINVRRGDPAAAISHFRTVVERGGPRGAVLANVALALEVLGRFQEARIAIDKALKRAPHQPRLQLSRAIILQKLGELPEAAEAFARYRESLGEARRPPLAYFVFATVAEAGLGNADAALRLGREGLALYPDAPPLLLQTGALLEQAGDLDSAEPLYRRAFHEDADTSGTDTTRMDLGYHAFPFGGSLEGYPDEGDGPLDLGAVRRWRIWYGLEDRAVEKQL